MQLLKPIWEKSENVNQKEYESQSCLATYGVLFLIVSFRFLQSGGALEITF